MSIAIIIIIYLCFSIMYRQCKLQFIFILKNLQTLKISKYRVEISKKIEKHEKRFKWFLFWPILDMYEWYENWQANRSRNTKS
jgi:hypothetical protein